MPPKIQDLSKLTQLMYMNSHTHARLDGQVSVPVHVYLLMSSASRNQVAYLDASRIVIGFLSPIWMVELYLLLISRISSWINTV